MRDAGMRWGAGCREVHVHAGNITEVKPQWAFFCVWCIKKKMIFYGYISATSTPSERELDKSRDRRRARRRHTAQSITAQSTTARRAPPAAAEEARGGASGGGGAAAAGGASPAVDRPHEPAASARRVRARAPGWARWRAAAAHGAARWRLRRRGGDYVAPLHAADERERALVRRGPEDVARRRRAAGGAAAARRVDHVAFEMTEHAHRGGSNFGVRRRELVRHRREERRRAPNLVRVDGAAHPLAVGGAAESAIEHLPRRLGTRRAHRAVDGV